MENRSVEDYFAVSKLPEHRLDVDSFRKPENRSFDSNNVRNRRLQKSSSNDRSRSRNKHSSINDKNHNSKNSKADRNFNRMSSKTEHAERDRSNSYRNKPNDDESRKLRERFLKKNNTSTGSESSTSKSGTFSVPSCQRSSYSQRTVPSETERTNWRDKRPKLDEKSDTFRFNEKADQSSRPHGSSERDNESGHRNQNYDRELRNEPRPRRNENNSRNESNRPPDKPKGYRYLKSLSEKEPHEMICEILSPNPDIGVVLDRKELQPDWIMLIMETVRKLCESDFKGSRIQILLYFCQSALLDHVSRYLGDVGLEKSPKTIQNLNSFVSDLICFYSDVINTIPTVAVDKNLMKFLTKTEMGIMLIKTYLNVEIDATLKEKLANLKKILEDQTNIREKNMEKPRRKYLDLVGDMPPPDDFRELSIYPTQEDLNRNDFGFIRPNKIKGAYEDVNHYLDVQFRLIREDFIGPLRNGLRNFKDAILGRGKPKYKYESVRFYPNVRIENIEITKENQVAYVVNFNLSGRLRNIKWEYSKWFMFGSLLIFTRDNFDTFFFATVYNRDLEKLKTGRILVTPIGNEPLEQEMLDKPFLMAESEVYFEPYCLVMKALKDYNEDEFPMKQFIVDGNTRVDLPKYSKTLENFYVYDYSVNLANNDGWPEPSSIGFDEHQFNAFKTALTSNFTVIQGPPGTGKTYLGLKIVEVLLKNVVLGDIFRTPILLVCYTNHALDQFLEGILNFTQRIVRVGGQSKSEALKRFNLRGKENLMNLRREARKLYPAMNQCRDEMRTFLSQLKKQSEEKKMIEFPKGILSYNTLSDVMNPAFKKEILNEKILLEWLLPVDIHNDSFTAQDHLEDKDVNVGNSTEPKEINEDGDYEDETTEASVLINEDDVFDLDDQKISPKDMFVKYCISTENLRKSISETRSKLFDLEKDQHKIFDDYSEYHNTRNQLMEELNIAERQYTMLNYHLQNAKLDSFTEYPRRVYLWEIPINERWSIYWSWVSQLNASFTRQLKNLEADYRTKFQQYEELKQLEDFHVVKNSLVVGMTTTCAARLQLLLKTLKPAIVIVEEAAEVLEAHIVVSLSKNCEHVILIGDHKQLQPSAAVYELSKQYNINVSLFERMINNNMYCPQLLIQHRMRSEISSLIVPSIYPNLKNHESVLEYPSVKGITKNLFFVDHTVFEEQVENSSSRKNKFEADFMIELCRYLLLQGYTADQITILTTYTGQMFLLREAKRDHAIMKNIKVIVVDKYQGEENDIILLSLVRSNEERKIGFLSIENRVCVALSRAKIGLYIIGNMDILSDSAIWKNIKEELVKQGAIGQKLTLYCDKHDVHTQVSCEKDFNQVLEGGCFNFCNEPMDCGHKCTMLCHKIDLEHLEKKCREKCMRKCVEGHPCQKYCFEDCGKCTELIERILPCEHKVTLPCFKDYEHHLCQVEISVVLESCSHKVKKKCYQSMAEVKCTFPCEDRLECGHQCVKTCHKNDDPDHLEYKCPKPCDKMNRGCSRQHKCEKLCFQECGKCKKIAEFTLRCGHLIDLECSSNLDNVKCFKQCGRKCAECNFICRKKCFEDCKPCKNKVLKRVPDCDHEIKVECSIVVEKKLCQKKCRRIAPCGHKCMLRCGETCSSDTCREMVKSTCVQALCGHGYVSVPCCKKNEVIDAEKSLPNCIEPCATVLKCGDLCAGTCGSCWQGRLHKTCGQKCGNVLVCGHSCTFPCRNVCPPCPQKCQYACKHSTCSRDCGVPCVHCEEKCKWKCKHTKCTKKCGQFCDRNPCYEPCTEKLKCGHDCIGFCGEPCPEACRICDKDEVTDIFFGYEDLEDARFVLLEDCGHYFESEGMDTFISQTDEKGEIVMKTCPKCKKPITKTLRYMNQVKKVYRDIQNVKKKVYGNENDRKEIREDLMQKLRNLDLRKNHNFLKKELQLIPKTVIAFMKQLQVRGKQSHISSQNLKAMKYFAEMFSSIISRLTDLSGCTEIEQSRVLKRLEFMLIRLNPATLLINAQRVDDIHRELERYHRMVDHCVCLNKLEYISNRNSPNVIAINDEIVGILYGIKRYDDEQDAQIKELFEKLQKELKSVQPLSQEEKRMIHAAMAKSFLGGVNKQGHWFTCTNGHYYCITECGGAMEESKCPECGEKIGGRDHRYVETARLASDMDGATRPAWTSGNDIRNFHL